MAGNYNITIEQGATFELVITVKQSNGSPMDLTGYTGSSQIRKTPLSATVVKAFTVTFLDPRTDGKVKLSLTDAETSALSAGETPASSQSQYVYDFEITSAAGKVTRLLAGKVTVSAEVTR